MQKDTNQELKKSENNREEDNKIEKKVSERRTFILKSGSKVVEPFSNIPIIIAILIVLSIIAGIFTRVDIGMFIRNISNFFDILIRMFPPNFPYLEKVWQPMVDTIQMSLLGSMVGAIFALPVSLFASTNIIKNKITIVVIRFILSIFRTLPVLVYALMLTMVFGFGPFAGTVAIAIFTFAIVSKMLYEKIETIDMGAFIAIESTGAGKVNTFTTAVLPQIMPNYLSIALYSFEINIRYAAILGYVGAGGIGILLNDRMNWRDYDSVITVLLVLLVTVVAIESLSRYIRRRLG
ncbi:MAG: phosphonate ABC transporter, permease protein PhnE [Candidatus Izimaplasma sp.]|nr:phosphonate ABC transporter, permease protein PhnE [Candidatus Izimaplasma bacterium]